MRAAATAISTFGDFSRPPTSAASSRRSGEPVERALQDEGGGGGVDLLGALPARHVRLDHGALGRRGRQPLVPEHDGSGGSGARLRRNARVAWARGPSVLFMLIGRPSTSPPIFSRAQTREVPRRPWRISCGGLSRAASRAAARDRRARCRSSWSEVEPGQPRAGVSRAGSSSIGISGPGAAHRRAPNSESRVIAAILHDAKHSAWENE